MGHRYFIPNEELFGGLRPDDRDQWPEAYTWVCGDVAEGGLAERHQRDLRLGDARVGVGLAGDGLQGDDRVVWSASSRPI